MAYSGLVLWYIFVAASSQISANGYSLLRHPAKITWDEAVMWCQGQNGSLAAPIDNEVTAAIMNVANIQVEVETYWTPLRINSTNHLTWHGTAYHVIDDVSRLPWASQSVTLVPDACVAMEISKLQTTLKVVNCGTTFSAMCRTVSVTSRFTTCCTDEDYTSNVTDGVLSSHSDVTDESTCAIRCLATASCVGYVFNASLSQCELHSHWSSSTEPPPMVGIYKKIAKCEALQPPQNGLLYTEGPGSQVGDVVEYQCTEPWQTLAGLSTEPLQCRADGRWSALPFCRVPALHDCPDGWLPYEGVCFWFSTNTSTWREAEWDCSERSAVLLRMPDNVAVLEKLLHFRSQASYWTAGTDQEVEGEYRWSPAYSSWYQNKVSWHSGEPTGIGEDCLLYTKNFSGVITSKPLFADANCQARHHYICQKGRRLLSQSCTANSWCAGGATCSWGGCSCTVPYDLVAGSTSSPSCLLRKHEHDSGVKTAYFFDGTSWSVAMEACKQMGGSLIAPVSVGWESRLQGYRSWLYEGYRLWTGLQVNDSAVWDMGVAEFAFLNKSSLPWRNGINPLSDSGGCVSMEITNLGVRLFRDICTRRWAFLCQWFDVTSRATSQGAVTLSQEPMAAMFARTLDHCASECFHQTQCAKFGFQAEEQQCLLYNNSALAGPSRDVELWEKNGHCAPLSTGEGAALTSSVSRSPGSNVTFTCNDFYNSPPDSDGTTTCQDGLWSYFPYCDYSQPCPEGWLRHGTSCYLITMEGKGFWAANSVCQAYNAYSLEVDGGQEEMEFLVQMLSFNSSLAVWTGGTDEGARGWYRWLRTYYTEMDYTDWYNGTFNGTAYLDVQPDQRLPNPASTNDNDKYIDERCVELRKIYKEVDWGRHFFSDNQCKTVQPFVCETKVLNVGSRGCSAYGAGACKTRATCQNDVCTCPLNDTRQTGADDTPATRCDNILSVGSSGCTGRNDLCTSLLCDADDVCRCPPGTFQNGQDLNPVTTCDAIPSGCALGWRGFGGNCYKLFDKGNFGITLAADQECILNGGLLAFPRSQQENDFILELGDRVTLWIGIHGRLGKLTTRDGESINALNFTNWFYEDYMDGFVINETCAYMLVVGKWVVEKCVGAYNSIDMKICTKPKGCPTPAEVANAANVSHVTYADVGETFTYMCDQGYVLAGDHVGVITCFLDKDGSVKWSTPPTCTDVLTEVFEAMPTSDSHGDAVLTGPTSDAKECGWQCYENPDCVSFAFQNPACTLYGPGSSVALSSSADNRKRTRCPPVPYVQHADIVTSGRDVGDTVRYTCTKSKYIAKNETRVITCMPDGQWQTPPTCRDRFVRAKLFFDEFFNPEETVIYSVPSLSECETLCLQHRKYRCLAVRYEAGICYLHAHPYSDYPPGGKVGSHSHFWYSQLVESDLEEFAPFYGVDVTSLTRASLISDLSAEECAQRCLDNETCKAFTLDTADYCSLYDVTPDTSSVLTGAPPLFLKNAGCPAPPAVANGQWEQVLRQKAGVWSVGDVLQLQCTTLGTDLMAGHSGLVSCLKTGHWSHAPVCANPCEANWFHRNGTCYRMFEAGTSFWAAHDACQALDASLLHLQSPADVTFPVHLRDESLLSQTHYWLGLFADRSVWHWVDRHRGNVTGLNVTLPPLTSDAAVAMEMTGPGASTLVALSTSSTTPGYVCTKAAPRLQCKAGWQRFNGSCYLVSQNTLDFDGAEAACQALGANLAPYRSWADDNMLKWMLEQAGLPSTQKAYLGMHRETRRDYVMIDGSPLTFAIHHATSDPASARQCLAMNSTSMDATDSCDLPRLYVCSAPLENVGEATDFRGVWCATDNFCGSPDLQCTGGFYGGHFYPPTCRHSDCPVPWIYEDGKCVMMTNVTKSYYSMTSHCAQHGGKVMTVDSVGKNYFLVELGERHLGHTSQLWVGLDKASSASALPTYPGNPFSMWRSVDAGTESCVVISPDIVSTGYWATRACDAYYYGFCERRLRSAVTELDYFYEGCFGKTTPYDLNKMAWSNATLTVDLCRTYCSSLGFKFAGLNGQTCECAHSVQQKRRVGESSCSTSCPGNSSVKCGGPGSYYSVYRTSDVACGSRQWRAKEDPQACYTAGLEKVTWSQARLECARQGGKLTPVHTPLGQQDVFVGAMAGIPSSTSSLAYLNMYVGTIVLRGQKYVDFWSLDNEARHFSYFTSSLEGSEPGKTCVAGRVNGEGAWQTLEREPSSLTAAYVCQFRRNASIVTGSERRTLMFRETRSEIATSLSMVTSSSLHRYRRHLGLYFNSSGTGLPVRLTSSAFGHGCLNDRSRCPHGFTLTLWIRVDAEGSSDVDILSSGDCASAVLPGRGLCLLYSGASEKLLVVDVQDGFRRLGQAALTRNQWHQVALVAANQSTMLLYLDGVLASDVTQVPPRTTAPTMTFDDVLLGNWHSVLQGSGISISHVTMTPRVLRWHELQELYERGTAPTVQADGRWGLGEASSLAPLGAVPVVGVSGQGRGLSHRGAALHLSGGNLTSTCAGDLGQCAGPASLSFWIKVDRLPSDETDVLRSGGSNNQNTGLRMRLSNAGHLTAKLQTIGGQLETQTTVAVGQWTSVVVAVQPGPSLSLFLNGQLANSSSAVTSGTNTPSDFPVLALGQAVCPLGWERASTSCYKMETTGKAFWAHVTSAMQLGAHLVHLDSTEELEYFTSKLYNSGKQWLLGTYQESLTSAVTWANALGSPPDLNPGVSYVNTSQLTFDCTNVYCNVSRVDDITTFPAIYEMDLDDNAFPPLPRCGQSSSQWYHYQGSCYYIETIARSPALQLTQCSSKGARLLEVNDLDELNFISQLIMRGEAGSSTVLVGLSREVLGDGTQAHVHSDWRQPSSPRWQPGHPTPGGDNCTLLQCSTRDCVYVTHSCSSTAKAVCERPAELECAPGWTKYGSHCLQAVTSAASVGVSVCRDVGATGLTFDSVTELQDIAAYIGLSSATTYLTDGVVQGGVAQWCSAGRPLKDTLKPTGTGLYLAVKGSSVFYTNGPFTSIVCQYEHEMSVAVDEVEYHDKALSTAEVTSIHQALAPIPPKQLRCPMDSVTSAGVTCTVTDGTTSSGSSVLMAGSGIVRVDHSYFLGVSSISSVLQLPVSSFPTGQVLCLTDVTECRAGFTVAFWVYVTNGSDVILFGGIGQPDPGVVISYSNWRLNATVREPNFEWSAWTWLPPEDWSHVTVTWDDVSGLAIYVNSVPVAQAATFTRRFPYRGSAEASSGFEVGRFLQGGPVYLSNLTVAESVWSVYNIRQLYDSKLQWYRQTFDDWYHPEESNLELSPPVSNSSLVWRNSFFKHALSVSNPKAAKDNIFVSQNILLKCQVQVELCRGPLTVSLWLNPLDFESDQLFLRAVTPGQQGTEAVSWYLSYQASSDSFWFVYHVGRRGVKLAFRLDFLRWTHLVAHLDPDNFALQVFADGVDVGQSGFQEWLPNNPPTLHVPSRLQIGGQGTFHIDDVTVETGRLEAESFYLLRSCHEYRLAGFRGRRRLQVDPDGEGPLSPQRITCDFDLDPDLGISVLEYNVTLSANLTGQETFDASDASFSLPDDVINHIVSTSQFCRHRSFWHYGDGEIYCASIGYSGLQVASNDTSLSSLLGVTMTPDVTNAPQSDVLGSGGALTLNGDGVTLQGLREPCLTYLPRCKFGYSFSSWLYVINAASSGLTIHEAGGDVGSDEIGVRLHCSQSATVTSRLDCGATAINSTGRWRLDFSMLLKRWTHVSMTWNPQLGLKLFLNGHNLAELGVVATYSEVVGGQSAGLSSTLGKSGHVAGRTGSLLLKDVRINDRDVAEKEIRLMFGTEKACSEGWVYDPDTELCYNLTLTPALYDAARQNCRAKGGSLALLGNDVTLGWLRDNVITPVSVTSAIHVGMTQTAAGGAFRWLDGTSVTSLAATTASTSKLIGRVAPPSWTLSTSTSTSSPYVCQREPYALPPKELFLAMDTPSYNYTRLDNSDHLTFISGLKGEGVDLPQPPSPSRTLLGECLGDLRFCHNGWSLSAWFYPRPQGLSSGAVETLITTVGSDGVGLALLGERNTTNGLYQLTLSLNNCSISMATTFAVTTNAWYHLHVSLSNFSAPSVLLNGLHVSYLTKATVTSTAACPAQGSLTSLVVGSTQDGQSTLSATLDELQVLEHELLNASSVHQSVQELLPHYWEMPFEARSTLASPADANLTEGRFGYAPYFDGTSNKQVTFVGQFAYDCLGSPDFCDDGLTLAVWVRPSIETSGCNYGIFSMANKHRGVLMSCQPATIGLFSGYSLLVRNHTHQHTLTFDLIPRAWSHLLLTWRDGAPVVQVNGQLLTTSAVEAVTGTSYPVVKLHFGHTDDGVQTLTGFTGAVDNFVFHKQSVNDSRAFQIYWKSVYVESPVHLPLDGTSALPGNEATPAVVPGVLQEGLAFLTPSHRYDVTSALSSIPCALGVSPCPHGLTVSFMVRFLGDSERDQTLIYTDGCLDDGLGLCLRHTARNTSMPFRRYFRVTMQTPTLLHTVWLNLAPAQWAHLLLSWSDVFGLSAYVDGKLAGRNYTGGVRLAAYSPHSEFPAVLGQGQWAVQEHPNVELDEVTVWDKAVESGVEPVEDWQHLVHHIPPDTPMAWVEGSHLEDCRDLCSGQPACLAFAFCPGEQQGTCYLHPGSVSSSASLLPNTSCDAFFRVRLPSSYLYEGCYDYGDIISSSNVSTVTHADECRVLCAARGQRLAAIQDGMSCYCGDALSLSTPLGDSECSTLCPHLNNETCGGPQALSIYRTSTLVDFVSPPQNVYTFTVNIDPGTVLLVNETANVTISIAPESFAGFHITCPALGLSFFTGLPYFSMVFSSEGEFQVQVRAMNEISHEDQIITFNVFHPVEGVFIFPVTPVVTGTNVPIRVNVSSESNMTCAVQYGDGVNYTTDWSPDNGEFTISTNHIYNVAGVYRVEVDCANNASSFSNSIDLTVQDAVLGLAVTVDSPIQHENNITGVFSLQTGTNVTLTVLLDGVAVITKMSESGVFSSDLAVPLFIYNDTGFYDVAIRAENLVSSLYLNATTNVEAPIDFAAVSTNATHHAVGRAVELRFEIVRGSSMSFNWTTGDGQRDGMYVRELAINKTLVFVYKGYATPGPYTILVQATNIFGSIVRLTSIFVEYPVDDVAVNMADIPNPDFTFFVNVSVDTTNVSPTNAQAAIDFGDATPVSTNSIDLASSLMQSLSHVFADHGEFTVEVTLSNNVSSKTVSTKVKVGGRISSLTVAVTPIHVPLGSAVHVSANVGFGSLMTYCVNFGDSSFFTNNVTLSFPTASFTTTHAFSAAGQYTIVVCANNTFNVACDPGVQVTVQQEIIGLLMVASEPVRTGRAMTFTVTALHFGTDSCFLWDFGDFSFLVVGGSSCANLPQYAGKPFQLMTAEPMTVKHTYKAEGTYVTQLEASNLVTNVRLSEEIVVLEYICIEPRVDILGFPKAPEVSISIPRSSQFQVTANIDSQCEPPVDALYTWTMQTFHSDTGEPAAVEAPESATPLLVVPERRLAVGLYQVNLTVSYAKGSLLSSTDYAFFAIVPSDLVIVFNGDDYRTATVTDDLVVNVSRSYDPDGNDPGEPLTFTWACHVPDPAGASAQVLTLATTSSTSTEPSLQGSVVLDPAALNLTGAPCFPGAGGQLMLEEAELRVGAGLLTSHQDYIFTVEARKGSRRMRRQHTVRVIPENTLPLEMRCEDNCGTKVSSTRALRYKVICTNCTEEQARNLTFLWQLFKEEGQGRVEITDLFNWTTLGVQSRSIVVTAGVLQAGSIYFLRVTSNTSVTERTLRTSYLPYGGSCSANSYLGHAFVTKFVVNCSEWLDEGTRSHPDFALDSRLKEPFVFRFAYQVEGVAGEPVPIAIIQGSEVATPEFTLRPGLPDFDHKVDILINITDRHGSTVKTHLTLHVLEDAEVQGQQVYHSLKYQEFQAEKDITALLLLNVGIVDTVGTADLQAHASHILEEVKALVGEVETVVQAQLLNKILLKLLDAGGLPQSVMDEIIAIYEILLQRLPQALEGVSDTELKQSIGTGILTGISKVLVSSMQGQSSCQQDCVQTKNTAESALTLYSKRAFLVGLTLESRVAGEYTAELGVGEGTLLHQSFRYDPDLPSPQILSLGGRPVASLPNLALHLDQDTLEALQVEVMESDRLYSMGTEIAGGKGRSTSVSFYTNGMPLQMKDLAPPISVLLYESSPSVSAPRVANATLIDLNNASLGIFYIKITRQPAGTAILVDLMAVEDDVSIDYYVGFGRLPSNASYDVAGSLSSNEALSQPWRVTVVMEPESKEDVFLGLTPTFDTTNVSGEVYVTLSAATCYYWNTDQKSWAQDGVMHGQWTDEEKVECLTNHTTIFGANFFVPPNTIDFSTVFSKPINDNVAVLVTVVAVFVLYLIIFAIVRREDIKDALKWSVEPLSDNMPEDVYRYQMTVYTGLRRGAGTKSKVFFVLGGDQEETEVRAVKDDKGRELSRGSVRSYILGVPRSLGQLLFLRLWHDDSGKGQDGSWYVSLVQVRDMQTNERYIFLADRWLALDRGEGEVACLLPAATKEELQAFSHQFLFQSRRDLTDSHLWFSVLSRPTPSVFSRVQRLSCCLSLLYTTMVANAMWYRDSEENVNSGDQLIHVGDFTFSVYELSSSVLSSLIVIPVSLAIVTFFRKSKESPKRKSEQSDTPCQSRMAPEVEFRPASVNSLALKFADYNSGTNLDSPDSSAEGSPGSKGENSEGRKGGKRRRWYQQSRPLPHWCVWLGWLLVAASVGVSAFFTVLYSLEWGKEKSLRWLTAFVLSFFQSVVVVQPVKVVAVALCLSLILRKVEYEDAEDKDEESGGQEEPATHLEVLAAGCTQAKSSMAYARPAKPAHRRPYDGRALDVSKLADNRQYRERQNRLVSVCWEVGIYVFYLIIVSIICYENRDNDSFREVDNIRNIFISPGNMVKGASLRIGFSEVTSFDDFWTWSEGRLLDGLYAGDWYNGETPAHSHTALLADRVHYRVGPPRIRQARVRSDTCFVVPELQKTIHHCLPFYTTGTYDNRDCQEDWHCQNSTGSADPWLYHSALELEGMPLYGRVATYSGGGYTAALGASREHASTMLRYLKSHNWLDRSTRMVSVELNAYNPHVNLFVSVSLVLEALPTGSTMAYPRVVPLRLYRYVGPSALIMILVDLVFVGFTIYYLVDLVKRLVKERCQFLAAFWNLVDLANVVSALLSVSFYAVHFLITKLTLNDFHTASGTFVNFEWIAMWDEVFAFVQAFLLFFSMLKLLRLIRFNSKVAQMAGTLRKAVTALFSFVVVFAVFFFAFTIWGHQVFGHTLREYSTMTASVGTLFSMLLMKVNSDPLVGQDRTMGAVFLFSFIFVVVVVLINMLLSIINEAFTDARVDKSCRPDDPEIVDFFLKEFKSFIGFDGVSREGKKTPADLKNRTSTKVPGVPSAEPDQDALTTTSDLSFLLPSPGSQPGSRGLDLYLTDRDPSPAMTVLALLRQNVATPFPDITADPRDVFSQERSQMYKS